MSEPFFESKAIEAYRRRGWGTPLDLTQTLTTADTIVLAFAIVGLFFVIGLLPFSETILLHGTLQHPAPYVETAPKRGLLETFTIRPGDQLETGDVIAYLRPAPLSESQETERAAIQRQLQSIKREKQLLNQQHAFEQAQKEAGIQNKLQNQSVIQALIKLEERQIWSLEARLSPLSKLLKRQFISVNDWHQQTQPIIEAKANILRLNLQRSRNDEALSNLKAALPLARVTHQQRKLDIEVREAPLLARLETFEVPARTAISASIPGRILSLEAETGDYIDASSPVAKIINHDIFQAALIVPARAQHILRRDAWVELKLTSHFPAEFGHIRAQITSLKPILEQKPLATGGEVASFRAIARLPNPLVTTTGRIIPFRPGSQLQVLLPLSSASLLDRWVGQLLNLETD